MDAAELRVARALLTQAPPTGPNFAAFRHGLRDLGWIEGRNLVIAHAPSDDNLEHLSVAAAELVRPKVDAIVAGAIAVDVATRARRRFRSCSSPARIQ